LLEAFVKLPHIGFLSADLEDDPHDVASQVRHHERPDAYTLVEENGVRLLKGPTGGGCAITSRELNERAGGFRQHTKEIFWLEDEAYIEDIERLGFQAPFSPTCACTTRAGRTTRSSPRKRPISGSAGRGCGPGAKRSSGCSSASRASAG
jgi:hypothetical protein